MKILLINLSYYYKEENIASRASGWQYSNQIKKTGIQYFEKFLENYKHKHRSFPSHIHLSIHPTMIVQSPKGRRLNYEDLFRSLRNYRQFTIT